MNIPKDVVVASTFNMALDPGVKYPIRSVEFNEIEVAFSRRTQARLIFQEGMAHDRERALDTGIADKIRSTERPK